MVAARVHRQAVEVLAKAPATAGLPRQELEAAVLDAGTAPARVHRQAVETLSKHPPTATLPRQELEAAVLDAGTAPARVHRQAVETLSETPAWASLTRQEVEVAIVDEPTPGVARVHRQAVEVLTRVGVPAPQPISYPAGLDIFLHNWANALSLETSYLTDISRSPTTLAEERVSLLERPSRVLRPSYQRDGKAELDRLLVQLRRLTRESLVFPLYMDAVVVSSNSGTLQRNIFCDPRYRRFYNGARVAVFPVAGTAHLAANFDVYSVVEVLPDRVVVERDLDQLYAAGSYAVVPCIDVEKVLDPSWIFLTDRIVDTSLDLVEIVGSSALPPSFTGRTPDGWQTQLGFPVFEIGSDWAEGLPASYLRYGEIVQSGRKSIIEAQGPRYVHIQPYLLKLSNREDFWRVLQFFDSMRGRGGAFWEIEREYLWTTLDTDPQFIDIEPQGQFSDFAADFTDHCGIVMKDGTVYVREINTIQTLGGSWRLSLVAGNNLPAIDVSQIDRFARARMKRFQNDSMTETWLTNTVCECELSAIEVLNDKEIEL